MDISRLSNTIQILSALAILVGLGLVVWELRQTREYMEFELIDRQLSQQLENDRVAIGEAPMEVYAKSCRGDDLSVDDQLILEKYFDLLNISSVRIIATSRALQFRAAGAEISVRSNLIEVLRIEQGKQWFARMEKRFAGVQAPAAQEIIRIGREILESGVPPCVEAVD